MTLPHDTALDEQPTETDKHGEVHTRAMQRFDTVASEQQEVRAKSLEARRFVTIPGAQWDGEWGKQFENAIKIESDKLRKVVRKIEADYRENRIVPDFRPDGPKAAPETADMLDGLHRADSYRFKSQQARDNAVFEAITGGFGAYRLTNELEDEYNPDSDHQRINPGMIITDADQSVYFDGNARLYDKSDARWAIIRVALTKDAFADLYGDDCASEWPAPPTWQIKDWFQPDTVAVAEYYEVEEVSEPHHKLVHRTSGEEKGFWDSEIEAEDLTNYRRDGWRVKTRDRKRRRVHKYVLSGAEVLEDRGYIAGPNIPIVPVYGKRYFVEGIERWEGCVGPKMDDQRLHNTSVSKLAEMNSLSPREVPIFAPEQMANPSIQDAWARANIDRKPYLLAEPLYDAMGNIIQNGPVAYVKPPDLPPALGAIIQYTSQSLMEDYEDGADTVKANTSAEAMDIAASRVDAKSGVYLDNIAQSVQREGEIYFGMAREVYSEAGREVETMTEDGDDGRATIKQAVTTDGKYRVINDLQAAQYKVIVSVTEATATRRDKTVRQMMNVATVAGQFGDMETAQAATLTAVMNMDGEGSDDFIAWARQKALGIGLAKPNEDEQAAMEAAAEEQQPDPTQGLIEAQAAALASEAQERAAKVVDITASAEKKRAETMKTVIEATLLRGQQRAAPVNMRG